MKYSLDLNEDLRNFLRHLSPDLKKKMKQVLSEIIDYPESGKALTEELKGLRSYRVGKIRIVYRVEGTSIIPITIGPRKMVYQKAALEIKHQLEQKGRLE